MKKIIHKSLFPNDKCLVCDKKVKGNALHCDTKECLNKWLENKKEKACGIK